MQLDLNTLWFVIVGILFSGYVILDGFDLGIGVLYLFTKSDKDRRLMLNVIGPVWDSNEVWLVTGGGALFAAFPGAYATVFSGFYEIFMFLLFGLIFRAVAIEFRSKETWRWWRQMWDVFFSLGSVLSSFIIGVTMGNIALGIPLDSNYNYTGSFLDLLNAYSIVLGVMTVAMFMMHASIYALMKTEGELHDNIRKWITPCIIFFLTSFFIFNIMTFIYAQHIVEMVMKRPHIWFLFIAIVLVVINIPRQIRKGSDFKAFLSSCFAMVLLMGLYASSVYPNLLFSNPHIYAMTIYNAASSHKTLQIMTIVAAIGMPMVCAYTICVYRVFRGKVKLDDLSY